MLDLTLRSASFRRGSFVLRDLSVSFPKSTCSAIAGPPGSGVSTLLGMLAGDFRLESGSVSIGTRDVTRFSKARRPLLAVTSAVDAPLRWSVRHLLIAAVRRRSIDRVDRQRELDLAVEKWQLTGFLDRRLSSLSPTEQTQANLARIELLHPAIVIADRLLERANASVAAVLADDFYRTMRVIGATVVTAPSSTAETGLADLLFVLANGRIEQSGPPPKLFLSPVTESVAMVTGEVNRIPVEVHEDRVSSSIGEWRMAGIPFQGPGTALVRPDEFQVAGRNDESDMVFGVEEASFEGGRWLARGYLSGGVSLRVSLPRTLTVHKGKLLALRYDPTFFTLVPSDRRVEPLRDVVPLMKDSR